jgi:hypothetical protein
MTTNKSNTVDEILGDYGLAIYKFKLYEPSAEWDSAKYKAKQAIGNRMIELTKIVSGCQEFEEESNGTKCKYCGERWHSIYHDGIRLRAKIKQEFGL